MTSSLRAASLDRTLKEAKTMAAELGITRVTDTTWLDYIGIPVYASIRPGALPGSLCVHAGKGTRPAEAKVGAYMEAIEFALAEFRANHVDIVMATPRQVSDQEHCDFRFVDLCPVVGRDVVPDGPLACVEAQDIFTSEVALLPAELIFSPYPENPGQLIFGTSTNGLSSGNSVDEATVHGLAEVIERDVQSFNFLDDRSSFVELDDPAATVSGLAEKVRAAGLDAVLRWTPNVFELPYFQAFVLEPDDSAPVSIAYGAGLHLDKSIAAVRAMAEAAQSRLSYIHGGRDDIIERYRYFSKAGSDVELQAVSEYRRRVTNTARIVDYTDIESASGQVDSIEDALSELRRALSKAGIQEAYRVVLTKPGDALSVVKVVVPKLESYEGGGLKRLGPRLMEHVKRTRRAT